MQHIPLIKRIIYRYLGYQYWFTYFTSTHGVLGIRLSTIVKLAAVGLVIGVWVYAPGNLFLFYALFLLLWIMLAYWFSKRTGYFRFVETRSDLKVENPPQKIPAYKQYPVAASGVFSLERWEKSVLFRPAKYWQVPRGDHAIMVEHEPHRYLYQFFDPGKTHELRRGWLIHGRSPNPALAISFVSIWGPEFSQNQYSIIGSEHKAAEPIDRTIYLSFYDEATERVVCHNIVNDLLMAKEDGAD
jgi:hypothetical protein